MLERQDLERLHQLAAEMIMVWSTLTDGLTDAEARPLIVWALNQGEATVGDLVSQPALVVLPANELHDILADRLMPLQRLMRTVGVLVAYPRDRSRGEIVQELEYILELVGQLPGPLRPPTPTTEVPLAVVASRLAGLESPDLVQAVLALVGGWPEDSASLPTGDAGRRT